MWPILVCLHGGDMVRMEITGLGVMETPVVDELR
jgi:hypothetical protein